MPTYTKQKLSGSTDGRAVKVTQTASPGDTIHQAHASSLDEIILSAWNLDTVDRTLTLQFGDNADLLPVTIPAGAGLLFVVPQEAHLLLTNSLYVRAYADAANKVYVAGCVNRIT